MQSHPIEFFKNNNIDKKWRAQQERVLNKMKDSWDKYKYFVLSLPTGVGKTFVATSIADSIHNAYILTSTLQLQDQYEKSWDQIVSLKGRSNYQCNLNTNFTVDSAPCSADSGLIRKCKEDKICAYYNQRDKALASAAMITNPLYMLYSTHCGFAKDDGEEGAWIRRSALIVDECHNLENHLVQFAESSVDPEDYQKNFGINTEKFVFSDDSAQNYLMVVELFKLLQAKAAELGAEMAREFPPSLGNSRDWARGISAKVAERVKKLGAKVNAVDKAIQPLKIFFNTHSTPEELTRRWIISKEEHKNILKLSPIYGDFLFDIYLSKLADKFIFLSATPGDKNTFCKELGIKPDECLYVETESPFDPAKSPVIVTPLITLSKDRLEENVKLIGGIVDDVMNMHPGQRGIIHSVTYNLQTEIFNRVSKENRKRLICRDMDILNGVPIPKGSYPKKYRNNELLEIHENEGGKFGSVLLAPSMMEGVDLHDDLSSFQIIVKLPWGNLGDPRIRAKNKIDGEWYANAMWRSILQASGRSTRHAEDGSVTYILDAKFKYFYDQWKGRLPTWFKDRLVF